MEVILLQKVANLGNIGDKVKVKPGYGRNYLLPQGKASVFGWAGFVWELHGQAWHDGTVGDWKKYLSWSIGHINRCDELLGKRMVQRWYASFRKGCGHR